MSITSQEVKNVASLARIKLSSRDVTKFQTELSVIIDYNATQLAQVKRAPLSSVSASPGLGQEDQARPSLSQELALSNALQVENGFIVIPKLLGES